jgi:two-component system, sensor histidine kinase
MQTLPLLSPVTQDLVSPELHQKLVNKVRATHLRELFTTAKSEAIPHLITLLAIIWMAWDRTEKIHLVIWLVAFVAAHIPIEHWAVSHIKRHGIPDHQVVKWTYLSRGIYGVNSLFFCYAYSAFALDSGHEDLFFTMIVAVMILLAQVSRADLKTLSAMIVPIFLTVLFVHINRGSPHDWLLAVMITLAFFASMKMAVQHNKHAFDALYNRFLMEDLARALQAKNEEVMHAKHEVEIASQAKSRFFAAASHDLRQPLHALSLLMGSLQLNIERQKNVQPTLKRMGIALESLETLFENVLDIAKLESGKSNVEVKTVSALVLFDKLEHEFEPLATSKGLKLKFRTPDLMLQTDGLLLERILRNLISNAIKYTDEGGILIGCRPLTRTGAVKIQVMDTGIGIASDQLTNVFEDFYQVPVAATERRGGVGLGLAIVKRLVDRLGHSINVQSQPNRGSIFTLQLPLSTQTKIELIDIEEPIKTAAFSLADRSILVVDDDQMVVDAIKSLLSDWHAKVVTAISSAELERVLETLSAPPDFIISDFQFEPSFSGADVVKRVRERLALTVPAAIITGNASLVPPHVSLMERVQVFAKPVNPAKLRALLHFNLLSPANRVEAV